jgi:ABC-2 type transport system permease protein
LTYAAEAMNKIMYYGGGIGDIWIDVVVLLGFSALFAALNVLLLKRYRRI